MRKTIAILLAAGALMAGTAASANRPVNPIVVLPSGDVVDLVTGIATTPEGRHYQIPADQLHALIEKQEASTASSQPPPKHADRGQPPQ